MLSFVGKQSDVGTLPSVTKAGSQSWFDEVSQANRTPKRKGVPAPASGWSPSGPKGAVGLTRVRQFAQSEYADFRRLPFPEADSGRKGVDAEVVRQLGDLERGDCLGYARAVRGVYPLVSKSLVRLASKPVTTAHLEGSFSAAKYLVGDHRTRMRPTVLKALTLLSCNRSMAAPFLNEIAREWLTHTWNPPSDAGADACFADVSPTTTVIVPDDAAEDLVA